MIKSIAQITAGILTDAVSATASHGFSYVNLNTHLLNMAINGDFEDGLIREELLAAGISPVRQLMAGAGIRLGGMNASSCGVFFKGSKDYVAGADALLPMFMQEVFEGALGLPDWRGDDLAFTSRPATGGDTVYPLEIRSQMDQRLPLPDQTLAVEDLVSSTFGIDSDGYKTANIQQSTRGDQNEFGRVAEGATLPVYTIVTAERTVRAFKYGGRTTWSYEAARRWRINQLVLLLQEWAYSEDIRRRKNALDVAVNGDGNGNGMIVTSTAATSGTIQSLDEWALDVAYNSSLGLNMFAGDNVETKAVRALRYVSGAQVVLNPEQLAMYGGPRYQMPDGSQLKLAPKNSILQGAKTLLGWNTSRGLEQVIENGSQIQEQERDISNQTNQLTMSINIAYGKPWVNSFQGFVHA